MKYRIELSGGPDDGRFVTGDYASLLVAMWQVSGKFKVGAVYSLMSEDALHRIDEAPAADNIPDTPSELSQYRFLSIENIGDDECEIKCEFVDG